MLWHNSIAEDEQDISSSDDFEGDFESVAHLRVVQIGASAIATECKEMRISRVLETFKA
jgi:hypothetical protein